MDCLSSAVTQRVNFIANTRLVPQGSMLMFTPSLNTSSLTLCHINNSLHWKMPGYLSPNHRWFSFIYFGRYLKRIFASGYSGIFDNRLKCERAALGICKIYAICMISKYRCSKIVVVLINEDVLSSLLCLSLDCLWKGCMTIIFLISTMF